MSEQPKEGVIFWKTALYAPPVIIGVGSLIAISAPRSESDWLGLGFLIGIFASVVLAMVVTVIAGTISFLRREPRAAACKITYLPSVLLLILGMPTFWEMYQTQQTFRQEAQERRQKSELRAQLIVRLGKDEVFRHELLQAESYKPAEIEAIMSKEILPLLNGNEIQVLWKKHGSYANIESYLLIGNTNAPADMLREHYREILEKAERQKRAFVPRTLAFYQETLLLHPNLPEDLIAEIRDLNEPSVNAILMKNPQFKPTRSKTAKP